MIKIIDGNLFDSKANIICHQCNCQGVMGSGVAAEVKRRYPEVYTTYRHVYETFGLNLGEALIVETTNGEYIGNLLGQEKYGYDGKQYTHYDKLQDCFNNVKNFMQEYEFKTVAFPWLMSCHRGGGDWNIVYKMIEDTFKDFDVEIWRLDKG